MAAEVQIDIIAKDNFSSTLGNFGSIVTGIQSAIHLAGEAFDFFKDQALAGLEAVASYERLEASLTSLVASQMLQAGAADNMAAALKVAQIEAEGLVKWNEQLAINSPFTSEGVAQAFRMAMAYGFTTDEAKRLTEALIDFAAGSGATEFAMQAIARALGQISATGKVTGGDMLQLVNAGLPVVEILAEGFGVTTAELMKMREQGLLPATEAIEYITKYLEENFAGAAERQATSWAGLLGTFEDIKQIGLREFFGGMFEALQPLAVELSTFLQTEGMEKLKEWGEILGGITAGLADLVTDGKLYELGYQLQELGGKDSFFYALGTALRVFQQAIDDGATTREAFIAGLQKLTDLSGIEISADAFLDFIAKLDSAMADAVNKGVASGAFSKAGDAFGDMLVNLITGSLEEKDSELIPALGRALGDFFRGAVGDVYFQHSAGEVVSGFFEVLFDELQKWGTSLYNSALNIGENIGDGMRQGLENIWNSNPIGAWIFEHVIDPIKKVLGISSPSTVFFDIGRDMMQGLFNGIMSMLANVLGLFAPILSIFGIDLSGGQIGPIGGGTTDGRSPITPDTRGGLPTAGGMGGNTLIFYGPVYVGSINELMYDCAQTNPLLQAGVGALP